MSSESAASKIGIGFGIAAAAALAQMGLAWGFGLLSWSESSPGVYAYRQSANTAWVTWFAAVSVVVGGLASGMMGSYAGTRFSALARLGAVVAAAVGGFVTGPLVSLAAHQGTAAGGFPAGPIAAAGIGIVVGFALTLIALASVAVAVNVGASVALVWAFAVFATFTDIGSQVTPVVELGVWGRWGADGTFFDSRGLSIGLPFVTGSFLIGAVVAAFARKRPTTSSGYRMAAASGIAGPLVVAIAHFVSGPANADSVSDMALLNIGPTACVAGILGSLIVAALPRSGGQIDDGIADPEEGTATAPQQSEPDDPPEPANLFEPTGSQPTVTKTAPAKPAPAKAAPAQAAPAASESREKTRQMPVDDTEGWVQDLRPLDSETTDTNASTNVDSSPDESETAKPRKKTKKKAARRKKKPKRDESDGSAGELDTGGDRTGPSVSLGGNDTTGHHGVPVRHGDGHRLSVHRTVTHAR